MSSPAGQTFDPANWQAHYAAVRARLQPQPKTAPCIDAAPETPATREKRIWSFRLPKFLPDRDRSKERLLTNSPAIARIEWAKMAERLLQCEQAREGAAKYSPADIKRLVAARSCVSVLDMDSARRTAAIVMPRQIAMWLCKKLTTRSLPEIGRRFGGRDHTTVLHAVRKIEALYQAASLPEWAMTLANQMFAAQEPTP